MAAKKAIKNVIYIKRNGKEEVWGSLTEICDLHGFPYATLARKKFPFEHLGWQFSKIPFRQKSKEVLTNKTEQDGKD